MSAPQLVYHKHTGRYYLDGVDVTDTADPRDKKWARRQARKLASTPKPQAPPRTAPSLGLFNDVPDTPKPKETVIDNPSDFRPADELLLRPTAYIVEIPGYPVTRTVLTKYSDAMDRLAILRERFPDTKPTIKWQE